MNIRKLAVFLTIFSAFATCFAQAQGGATLIRVGAFPNITHSQPMVGKANGWFEKAMGARVKIDWKASTQGPRLLRRCLRAQST